MSTTWKVDPVHTHVQFSVRHMMVANVKGVFCKTAGSVVLPDGDLTKAEIAIEIDANSIDTREPQRDAHLKSPDFLDANQFPQITFRSNHIAKSGSGYTVAGDLTIHGVTKTVALNVEAPGPEAKDPWGGIRRGFEAHTEINRKDFGLVWNQALETGGVLIGDKVKIDLEVELIQA
jgi:polyisoprenoid-binding protein YceI